MATRKAQITALQRWDKRFLEVAQLISTWSKDPSTRVGCVVVDRERGVISTGYNGLPRGLEDTTERLNDREQKLTLIVHAEENALLHAARVGVSLHGCTLYATWPLCVRCAVSVIQTGIGRVVYPADIEFPTRWLDDFKRAADVLREVGVIVDAV